MADAIARLNELKSTRRRHHRRPDGRSGSAATSRGSPASPRPTDLNIVVATGSTPTTTCRCTSTITGPGTLLDGPEIMTDMFVRDIDQGIADTGIKAAILKCATDEPGRHARRRAGAAGRRAGAPPDRRADLDAHPRRHPARARAAAHLRRGGRRPVPRRDRPLRRHHRHRLPRGAHRQRLLHRDGPVRASTRSCRTEDRVNTVATMCERGHADKMVLSHDASCYFDCAARGTGARRACRTGTTCTSTTTCIPALQGARRHRRADHHDAGGQPAQDLRNARAGTEMTDGRPADRHAGLARWPRQRPTRPRSPATGRTLTRGELEPRPTGWRARTPTVASASATT